MKHLKRFNESKHTPVETNRYVYHTSNPIFRDKIASEGLIPKAKSEAWLSDTKIDGKVIFAVNTRSTSVQSTSDDYKWDSTYDDDIYQIDTSKINNQWYNDPNLFKYEGDRKLGFTWNEIKDYYIPFLYRLSNLYSIEPVITIELVYINGNGTNLPLFGNAGRKHIKIDELEDYSKEYEEITKDTPIKIGNVLVTVEGKL